MVNFNVALAKEINIPELAKTLTSPIRNKMDSVKDRVRTLATAIEKSEFLGSVKNSDISPSGKRELIKEVNREVASAMLAPELKVDTEVSDKDEVLFALKQVKEEKLSARDFSSALRKFFFGDDMGGFDSMHGSSEWYGLERAVLADINELNEQDLEAFADLVIAYEAEVKDAIRFANQFMSDEDMHYHGGSDFSIESLIPNNDRIQAAYQSSVQAD